MNYCEHCGGKLNGVVFYCPNCGAPIKEKINENSIKIESNIQSKYDQNKVKDNTTVIAFVCSLIGLLCCCGVAAIPGLILSIISLVNMKDGKISSEKKGLAIAALIISILAVCSGIFSISLPNYNQEIIDNVKDQLNIHYE